jgi:excisionase family DNA binding protein
MARTGAGSNARTYFPEHEQDAQIFDFMKALDSTGAAVPSARPALVGADGSRVELPESMHAVLKQVAEALASGMGVTVAPQNARLTTQEAADFLGMSRPTLVRLLESGKIPMSKPGRHRYVELRHLLEYQEASRRDRHAALAAMARDAEDAGLYAATDGPPPKTR